MLMPNFLLNLVVSTRLRRILGLLKGSGGKDVARVGPERLFRR